ncbi:MAG: hypothetical protein H3C48_04900 [Chitinophagaceae bacterium]|nr:hypothetical protein [Chitinophagaceae bacterium]
MKNILKYKIASSLILSPVFVTIGAYQFVIGNKAGAHSWFLWGIGALIVGVLWLILSRRIK